MADHVAYSAADGVATLRLDRPEKKNALTLAMYDAMTARMAEASADAGVRCLVVAGAPGAFSAGNDIEDFVRAASGGGLGDSVLGFLRALVRFDKPIVAAVDGAAVGVGTTILLHCDHVVASDRSVFATPFVDLGLVPEAASSLIAPRLMGHQRAFELLVMGRRFDAARAREAGFVSVVVAPEALETTAIAAAREIAGKPAGALALARRLLRGDPAEILARIDEEAGHFRERLASPEAMQAFMGFLARKKG
jgi:enoyl-CoA hydratase/carnithine racemase